jgi:hypothetical protein
MKVLGLVAIIFGFLTNTKPNDGILDQKELACH